MQDATRYFVSLPVNKLELWFAMESERFLVRPMPLTSHEYEEVWKQGLRNALSQTLTFIRDLYLTPAGGTVQWVYL